MQPGDFCGKAIQIFGINQAGHDQDPEVNGYIHTCLRRRFGVTACNRVSLGISRRLTRECTRHLIDFTGNWSCQHKPPSPRIWANLAPCPVSPLESGPFGATLFTRVHAFQFPTVLPSSILSLFVTSPFAAGKGVVMSRQRNTETADHAPTVPGVSCCFRTDLTSDAEGILADEPYSIASPKAARRLIRRTHVSNGGVTRGR